MNLTGKPTAYCSKALIGTESFPFFFFLRKKTAQYSQYFHMAGVRLLHLSLAPDGHVNKASGPLSYGLPRDLFHQLFKVILALPAFGASARWFRGSGGGQRTAPEKASWAHLCPPEGAVGSRRPRGAAAQPPSDFIITYSSCPGVAEPWRSSGRGGAR